MRSLGLPENLSMQDTVELGGIVTRVNSYQPASPQSNYYAGQQITFQLSNDFLDFRNHSWQFTVTTTTPGSTYARFNKDIRSIIKRMTISFGSKIVYDCNNQNLLFNAMNNLKDIQWSSNQGVILNGTGSTVQRGADFTDASRTYAVQLYNFREDLLSRALPLQKLGLSLFINIYLAPVSECIETDSLAPTYIVNDNQFHISALVPSSDWDSLYNSKISRGISYCYKNYENAFDSSLLTVGITRASKTLNFRYTSLIGIMILMRPSANIQNLTANDKLNRYDFNNLNRFNVRLGSYVNPTDDLTNYADRYTMVCEMFGKSTQDPIQAAVNYNTTNFMICANLSKHPFFQNKDCIFSNGMNTSVSSALILDFGFSAPLAANYTIDIFGISENSVIFQSNGGIVWQN